MAQITSGVSQVRPGTFALRVSPNPFTSALYLTFDSARQQDMEFELRDLNGRNVFAAHLNATAGENSAELQISDIPSGIYVGLLHSSEGTDVQKLIRLGAY